MNAKLTAVLKALSSIDNQEDLNVIAQAWKNQIRSRKNLPTNIRYMASMKSESMKMHSATEQQDQSRRKLKY